MLKERGREGGGRRGREGGGEREGEGEGGGGGGGGGGERGRGRGRGREESLPIQLNDHAFLAKRLRLFLEAVNCQSFFSF